MGQLDYLRFEHNKNRKIVLVTGTDRIVVEIVSLHVRLFSVIVFSDERVNMAGRAKANMLRELFDD